MAGDRARVSYDPSRKWRGLIAQQGRVTVEADWNEAATISQEHDRLVTLDVVGTVGTPDNGYGVTAVPATAAPPAIPGDLQIGPGTLYLGGQRLDLDAPVTYSAQPDWLDSATDPLWKPPSVPSGAGTSHELVYLLASEQEVSAVEDPALTDVALGGPDTMGRQRILQHFVRLASESGSCHDSWNAFVSSLGSRGLQFDAASTVIGSATTLQVSFSTTPAPPSMCQPAATGGYLGAENQMIRVMVASVDPNTNVPTIVWGFDNASFLYRIQEATFDSASGHTTLTLASAPVDSFHYPANGQAVELLRDAVQLTGSDYIASQAGFVSVLTGGYHPASKQVVISGQPPPGYLSAATPQLYLRVWQSTVAAPNRQPIQLDGTGVAVTLASPTGNFHPGDFWRFALRPIQPAVVYPARYLTEPQPPDGPRTWACPLAMLTWSGGNATASSCVPAFSDLVELTATEGGCCTLDVGPSDVDDGASLQTLLAGYANRGPITVCLEPGAYTLSEPLVLGEGLSGITLQACRAGVVFQAPPEPGAEFTLGLIAIQGANSVTIRGIELSIPLVGFSPPSSSFSGLPTANQELLGAFSKELQISIGVSAHDAADLTVAACTFGFPDPGEANDLAAGIYATGIVQNVSVTGCTFQSADPPQTVPFYDLAAGNPTEPPYQPTFGYLQVPGPAQESSAPATAAAEAVSGTVPAADASANVTGQLLHDATIERCLFQGLTVPVLAVTQLGTLHVCQNTVRDCYGGFWLVSIADPSQVTTFDVIAIGDRDTFLELAGLGVAGLGDRIFVLATAIGRVLPATPPAGGSFVIGRILAPGVAQIALARQAFSALTAQATAADAASSASSPGAAGTPPAAGQAGPAVPEARLAGLPPALDNALRLPGPGPSGPVIPVAETGTSVSLRLAFCDCQIDAVIADSYSGAGLLACDLTLGSASMVVDGSRIRSRFPMGEAVLGAFLTEACITGNIVANEVPPPVLRSTDPSSHSIALPAPLTPLGVPTVAVTGNVFIDPTKLPARPSTIPSPLTDWDVLNTVVDYVTPPVVTGISPTSGAASGKENVLIAGSSFSKATGVAFGTVSAEMHVESDIAILATSPGGSGTVHVTVANPAGTSATSAADQFTYLQPGLLRAAEAASPAATPAASPAATPAAEPAATPPAEPAASPATEPAASPAPSPVAPPPAEPAATQPTEPDETSAAPPTAGRPIVRASRPNASKGAQADPDATAPTEQLPGITAQPALRLLVTNGPDAGRAFDLDPGEQIVGREEGSDIVLEDGTVSHNHALLRVTGQDVIIEDLDSTNGTRVNGALIERPTSLAPGDQVSIGDVQLVLEQHQTAGPGD